MGVIFPLQKLMAPPNVLTELSMPDGLPWMMRSAWNDHLLMSSRSPSDHGFDLKVIPFSVSIGVINLLQEREKNRNFYFMLDVAFIKKT